MGHSELCMSVRGVLCGRTTLTRAVATSLLSAGLLASEAQAATYTYTRTTSNTLADPGLDRWSLGESWDSSPNPPVSAFDTTLNFTGGDSTSPIAAGTTIFTTNDLGAFTLNQMNFTQYGTTAATAPVVTVTGGLLDFVANGATAPRLTVNTAYLVAAGNASANRIRVNIENNVRLAASSVVTLGGGSQLGTASSTVELNGGSVTLGAAVGSFVNTSGAESNAVIAGKITGAFGVQYGVASGTRSPVLVTSNSGNDYTGDTMLTGELSRSTSGTSTAGRTLQLGASDVIPNGVGKGNVTISMGTRSSYTLNLNGFSETINGLSSAGQTSNGRIITNSSTTTDSTLTLGDNDQGGVFQGQFTGTRLGLTKIGSGTQVISGTSAYSGATRVNGGTLTLDYNDFNNGTTATNAPTNHFSQTSTLVLNGGTLKLQAREDGAAVNKVVNSVANGFTFDLADTTGVVAGQAVRIFNNSNTTEYTATFVKSVDRAANRIFLNANPATPASNTNLRFEFAAVAAGVTSQALKGLTLDGATGSNSAIDFGAGEPVVLTFNSAPLQTNNGSLLTIDNWSGIPEFGGGEDRLLFTGEPVDFSNVFDQSEIVFTGFGAGYQLIDGTGVYEVVAVPEPASLAMLGLGSLGLLMRNRRR